MYKTLSSTLSALNDQSLSAQQLLDIVFANIKAPHLQGNVSFRRIFPDQAYREAKKWDDKRSNGCAVPPLAGIPFSVKDNFDLRGLPTRAASRLLENADPAAKDADFVAKLKRLGGIVVGQTNMTEFAYSGLGLNSHFGSPVSPVNRHSNMIAGGSSSGASVSVAEGMSLFAVGSDTCGSCRIPAACCNLVGYRPSQATFSNKGIIPLAPSFDVPGLIANSIECVAAVTNALLNVKSSSSDKKISEMKFLALLNLSQQHVDSAIADHFESFLAQLTQEGAIVDRDMALAKLLNIDTASNQIVAFEAYQYHKPYVEQFLKQYDPLVAVRLKKAASLSKDFYQKQIENIKRIRLQVDEIINEYDAVLCPTLPILPPTVFDLVKTNDYLYFNSQITKNTLIASYLDLPAISLPSPKAIESKTPISIQIIGSRSDDSQLLKNASIISKLLDRPFISSSDSLKKPYYVRKSAS